MAIGVVQEKAVARKMAEDAKRAKLQAKKVGRLSARALIMGIER